MQNVVGARRRILVIEDDGDLRDSLAQTLGDEGYDVALACHGAEALELLHTTVQPDLLLLDLMMPVMSGWEFRARQLRDPRLAAIPTVVMTATSSLEAAAIDACDLLLKPVELSDLLATVMRHIETFADDDEPFAGPATEPEAPRPVFDDADGSRHH